MAQVSVALLAADGQTVPDVLAINAASLALATSDIPWDGPVAAVRVARVHDAWVVNPSYAQLAQAGLQLLYAASPTTGPRLIEADGRLLCDAAVRTDALALAATEAASVAAEQLRLVHASARLKRAAAPGSTDVGDELALVATQLGADAYASVLGDAGLSQAHRDDAVRVLQQQLRRQLRTAFPAATDVDLAWALADLARQAMRTSLAHLGRVAGLSREERAGGRRAPCTWGAIGRGGSLTLLAWAASLGRAADAARPRALVAPALPDVVHGSALATFGNTQARPDPPFPSFVDAPDH
jgi:polyribonucleotide nucleotidyltransferase